MLCTRLFRGALAFQFTNPGLRSFSTRSSFATAMATPPQSFVLDRSIFNETLYSRLREFWLAGVPHNATSPPFEALQKWFGVGRSPEEKAAFDGECYSEFGEALEAIGPSKLALPAWEGYEKDLENVEAISAPLLAEVKNALGQNVEGGVQTLLSLSLLLDQMPRNIYRDGDGLRLVFTHYDRLAWSLLRSSMKLSPNPLEHENVKGRPLYLTVSTHSKRCLFRRSCLSNSSGI